MRSILQLSTRRLGRVVAVASYQLTYSQNLIHTAKITQKDEDKKSKQPSGGMFTIQPTSSSTQQQNGASSQVEFEKDYEHMANETLESLADRFDRLSDEIENDEFDVMLSNGVLTLKLGAGLGTYVINKQTPNLQVWLSSPTSGPKRFDYIHSTWTYRRTGETLHGLLSDELSRALKHTVDLSECAFAPKTKNKT